MDFNMILFRKHGFFVQSFIIILDVFVLYLFGGGGRDNKIIFWLLACNCTVVMNAYHQYHVQQCY